MNMQFVHPEVLWALLGLSIPIIIHLFHFRRFKKVYFTNVRFLKEIKEEKSARRQIRNFLVLLMRLLAYSFLVFAFAQPFISDNKTAKKGQSNVSIFIDNSFSMMAASEDIPLLDKAKKKAEEIISAYGPEDEFQILTHEMKSSQLRWLDKDNTIETIDDIELNPEVTTLETVINRQRESRPDRGNHIVYVISDFQKSTSALPEISDSLTEFNFIPLQAVKENNISIDSVWFESVVPALNQNNSLYVKISNHGEDLIEDLRMSLVHNGQTRPEGTIDIPAKSSTVDTVNILLSKAGWQNLEVRIEDYPVRFDDSYFLTLNVKTKVNVLSISNQNSFRYIDAVFRSLNHFDLDNVNVNSIQYDDLENYDLIILTGLTNISSGLSAELKSYVINGGNVMLFPDKNADIDTYNNLLNSLQSNTFSSWNEKEAEVYRINTEEFVFENVFNSVDRNLKLPKVKAYFDFNNFSQKSGDYILKFRNGDNFINKYNREKGNLFVCASPIDPDLNDLVLNAELFVPLLYKAAYASSQNEKKSYVIGKDNSTEVKSSKFSDEIIYKISGTEEFIPGQVNMGNTTLLSFNNMISESGIYNVTLDEEKLMQLAFNYDRLESKLDYIEVPEMKEKFGALANIIDNSLNTDLGVLVKQKDKGVILWRWCLIFALIFLALETFLLRFWKI